ncbi:TIGR02147 family protein [Halobacteriovorax sp. DA5]|uniref:TIGR02147 family protein n=1 Tax=Halobacteriovorax sp. DA5 TaxID=2067553 RepID=UPI000CD0A7CC|nr:TIGR02147 family protein [Halobacteriovorax sp. DA5]POB13605.1 hypothetical protein C0Z22_10600 [Halobacteriovorax sp. DA5]
MDIFSYQNYKDFTIDALEELGKRVRGTRSRLAEKLACQTAYISQVLNKDAHFSLEQALLTADFLSLSNKQTEFYLTLVNYQRAGNKRLSDYYKVKIDELVKDSKDLSKRLTDKKELTKEQQYEYYSSWHYLAIHAYLSITKQYDREIIATTFSISTETVAKVIDFLLDAGLITNDGDKIKLTSKSFHLGKNSPMIARHHSNWRLRAMESMDRATEDELHYSSVITLSKEDLPKVNGIMVKAIEEIREVVKKTTQEDVFCYTMDLFKV